MIDYGTDFSVTTDFTGPNFPISIGRQLLAEACVRRLITPLGSLIDHSGYGYDIRDELNDDLGPADLARISILVNTQLMRDARIINCRTITNLTSNGELNVNITITDGAGPFPLVLNVSAVTVQIVDGV
jgi:hypothetical protein